MTSMEAFLISNFFIMLCTFTSILMFVVVGVGVVVGGVGVVGVGGVDVVTAAVG